MVSHESTKPKKGFEFVAKCETFFFSVQCLFPSDIYYSTLVSASVGYLLFYLGIDFDWIFIILPWYLLQSYINYCYILVSISIRYFFNFTLIFISYLDRGQRDISNSSRFIIIIIPHRCLFLSDIYHSTLVSTSIGYLLFYLGIYFNRILITVIYWYLSQSDIFLILH